ncbi:WD40 repeat-containing protein [Candidatus Methanoperedens nitroreducens]|uniref:WD40 repeat-containing protein n=1 Tax=Candidatus Methanoperedens nitratireducens TaxID=1392998 RepID=A0A062V4Y2_9EURY|nr:TIR domain-containing protein [Candidatus Methanoperedens nitroreducens]KCZ70864.1 WD40 repeat-containing protein [Candidatus Methanoperedens nitroreducens]MDJ1420719.1 TIR domain-containing protein [Candidatus Methanoperedens sp.]
MTETFTYDVFISHSSRDKLVVRELAQQLKMDGLRVWFDEWEIKPGDMIGLRIEQGLEQSRCLILVMSSNAFASEWVALERHTALFRDPTNARRRFIPLRLDDAEIKDILKQFAYVDWRQRSDEQYVKLLEACRPPVVATKPTGIQKQQSIKTLKGHTRGVWEVAVTPDCRLAVSASADTTVRVWNLDSGKCTATLKGHTGPVFGVAVTADGRLAVSASADTTVRVWNLDSGKCTATLIGYSGPVVGVAVTADGRLAVSASADTTVRVWNLDSGKCTATLKGHTGPVVGVAVTADGRLAVSASYDSTMRVWNLNSGECTAILKGHTGPVVGVAVTADGRLAVSASADKTVRVWNLDSGKCTATLEGHTGLIVRVAVTADGRLAVSASADKTVRVWNLDSGECIATLKGHTGEVWGVAVTADCRLAVSASADNTMRVWNIPLIEKSIKVSESTRYANAKVVLLGETGVGKTGLALRLCENRWEPTESTHGMLVSQLKLPPGNGSSGIEREVWLWDFAGQPDYRLIHQLYMDETALGLLVFDPQDDNPFEDLGHWEKALHAAAKHNPAKLLVAARCDRGGITISNKRFEQFCKEHDFSGFLTTGAKIGEGCEELKEAIARHIPWDRLQWTSTTRLFKTLKDAILKLKEEGAPLVRLAELNQRLQLMLPGETIGEKELRAVVGLMQGQGVVQMLNFGDFVLLQPEQINRYASVVVRMAREHVDEMGIVPEHQVLDGGLDYKDMKRLAEADEKILLRAMVQTFLDRALCLREQTPKGTMLVFPSYFRRDKPDLLEHPNVFVTYGFAGPLDEIYATLVVKLSYSDNFRNDQLWKNAADFKTHGGKRVGLAMKKKAEGAAEIVVYFEGGVPDDTKVTFIKYVHEHLLQRAQDVTRVRTYVCPHCDTPVENRKAIQIRLQKGFKDIVCAICEERVVLLDLIEDKFASDEFLLRVREMDKKAKINLDNESRELILIGHATAIAGEAGQIFRPTPNSDWGIDGEIEFKDYAGNASGKRVYLQLKSGDSYLYKRKKDGVEVFAIKNLRHAEYWQQQAYPVMLVVRTSDGSIRWMDISAYLKEQSKGRTTPVKQIIFKGELFTALNLQRLRDKLIPPPI